MTADSLMEVEVGIAVDIVDAVSSFYEQVDVGGVSETGRAMGEIDR